MNGEEIAIDGGDELHMRMFNRTVVGMRHEKVDLSKHEAGYTDPRIPL